eukprot:6687574-Pyramimonas_sp.AAC.1
MFRERLPAWARLPQMSREAWLATVAGVLLVTFTAPTLGTWALFRIPLAAWNALGALGPVWAVPVTFLLKGEAITLRAASGSALAACGAALLGVTARATIRSTHP